MAARETPTEKAPKKAGGKSLTGGPEEKDFRTRMFERAQREGISLTDKIQMGLATAQEKAELLEWAHGEHEIKHPTPREEELMARILAHLERKDPQPVKPRPAEVHPPRLQRLAQEAAGQAGLADGRTFEERANPYFDLDSDEQDGDVGENDIVGEFNSVNQRPRTAIARFVRSEEEVRFAETLFHLDYVICGRVDLILRISEPWAEDIREEFKIARDASREFAKMAYLIARMRRLGVQNFLKLSGPRIGLGYKIEAATTVAPGTPEAELVARVKDNVEMFRRLADEFRIRMNAVMRSIKSPGFTAYGLRARRAMKEARIWARLEADALSVCRSLQECELKVASTNTQIFINGPGIGGRNRKSQSPFNSIGGTA